MSEKINEPIQVMVKFEKGKLIPLQFNWRRRDYSVVRVELTHSRWEGNAKLYYFSVAGEGAIYLLVFNSQTLGWRLGRIETIR